MKRILPVILILTGIAEIIISVMGIRIPVLIAIVLGILLIALGVETLLGIGKKKRYREASDANSKFPDGSLK